MMLGGRAAEHVTFGRITTGASDDIRRCTDIAYVAPPSALPQAGCPPPPLSADLPIVGTPC